MKLNADIGESLTSYQSDCDSEIMPFIDQANIACGGHAGDALSMARTIQLANQYKVSVGAHPSYPDMANFGRRSMRIPADELAPILHAQIGALDAIARAQNKHIEYVKPHGALYNDMMANSAIFDDVLNAIATYHSPLKLMILATQQADRYTELAHTKGISLLFEAFADRAYQPNGSLVSRQQVGAVLTVDEAVKQAQQLINHKSVTCIDGSILNINADSLCVHGDSPDALLMVNQIRKMIEET